VRIEHDRQPIHVIIGTTRMSPPSSGSICIYFASRHAPIGFGGSRWMAQPVQQMGRTDQLKPATPFIQTHRPTSSPPLSLRVFHRWAFTRSGIHYLAQPQCHPVSTSIFRLPVSRSPSLPICRVGGSVGRWVQDLLFCSPGESTPRNTERVSLPYMSCCSELYHARAFIGLGVPMPITSLLVR
jgi:hypothetical protein